MKQFQTYYLRNLPHYQPPGYTFFVTFRLTDSLPLDIIKKLQADQEIKLKKIAAINDKKEKYQTYKDYQQSYFEEFDSWLVRYKASPKWLGIKETAEIVKEAIHYRDGKEYKLIVYTIMPNHVHIVFKPIIVDRSEASIDNKTVNEVLIKKNTLNEANASFYIVTKILQDLKSKTALKANKLLNRSGAFWQHESYDHVVHDEKELRRIVEYVLNNPVKAGLCEKWEDWKYSYCNFKYLSL
jgi:REP element-mobilizing transposase RayT